MPVIARILLMGRDQAPLQGRSRHGPTARASLPEISARTLPEAPFGPDWETTPGFQRIRAARGKWTVWRRCPSSEDALSKPTHDRSKNSIGTDLISPDRYHASKRGPHDRG